ncbi:ribose 5-phosphate isomerase B [Candidatus Falkowbacteria bacterium RIFOXYC2_FULL_47_12]|uniref:Ribose 5-phosphate isomerase B n=2 Tax=Candidatus Falkowiibacteriota TaxID=1752728 RepID=A0A1F5TM40_9BACT|nr:MAG: ribose 5-phosphate isomerase B [Candidatus Falkowbacteria bacterium RIFOXYA2_FULL_47_9]OGF39877.1 MAG: ribose 5-phosphate isomerase B [Candidatus Falkowbacteria bacterium RIFOXYC2_FULL_47_12]
MTNSVIYLGADHAGFQLKERIKLMLTHEGFVVHDMGNTAFEQTDDYPDFAKLVGEKVAKGRLARGILVCGSGVGMSMAANKVKGVRAVLAYSEAIARAAVEHNSANVLCLGQSYIDMKAAEGVVRAFLDEKPSIEARHKRRVKKMKSLEVC